METALENLRSADALDVGMIAMMEEGSLEELITPSRFYRQKARYMKGMCRYLVENYREGLGLFFSRPLPVARAELLAMPGIGPETADSIFRHGGWVPTFVVDAYTIRICRRTGILDSKNTMLSRTFSKKTSDRMFSYATNSVHYWSSWTEFLLAEKTELRRAPAG